MEYEDVFELLESVRTHELGPKEVLIPSCSERGTHVGFCTADGNAPSTRWTISTANLKKSCEGRTSEEAQNVYGRMRFFHLRKSLVEDLRSGTLVLEERPAIEDEGLSMTDFLNLNP